MPLYVRILGIEAYGLMGFYLSLQAFFLVLDMGLSSTLNRELAISTDIDHGPAYKRDLVRTLEWLYWPMGAVIAIVVLLMSEPVAIHWLNPVKYGTAETARAIALMGLSTALQWPTALYSGGLRGLERQVSLNAMSSAFAVLRTFGSLSILLYVSPTLESFLWWQIGSAALQTALYRHALWKALPASPQPPDFRIGILHRIHRFTLGMAGIAVLSFLLMQSDRIILSTILPLDMFGYYTVAGTVAGALAIMIGPFFNALFPRYSALVGSGEIRQLSDLYHQSNQYVAVAVASVASVLAFFSTDVLMLWTQNSILAERSGDILSILVIGTGLNGIMHLPYALQLSYGWTRLALYQNIVAVAFVVPATWWAAHHYGGVGAALVWLGLNAGYIAIGIPIMHRRLLPEAMKRWYIEDILPPILASVFSAGVARLLIEVSENRLIGIITLGLIGLSTLVSAAIAAPHVRLRALAAWRAHFA